LSFVAILILAGTASAFQSIVVLPFSNESQTQQIYWLGEGFAESLSEEMFLKDAYIIQRPDRKAAYDSLRLPYVGHISRATMLKIGEKIGANYIVFGSYTLHENNLSVKVQVIQAASSRLSKTIEAAAPLDNLYDVQVTIKEGLKSYFISEKLVPVVTQSVQSPVPLHAYELYIKGLLESSDQEKVALLYRAIEAHPGYPEAILRLGSALFRLGRYGESNEILGGLDQNGLFRARVDFMTALNLYYSKDYSTAVHKWYEMTVSYPHAEIFNNIGIALIKKNELQDATWYLSRAVDLDPENADFQFNLAVCYFQKGETEGAVRHFREAILLSPTSDQALYWLAKTLEKAGSVESSRVMEYHQEMSQTGQSKGKFAELNPSPIQMLRAAHTFYSLEEKNFMILNRDKELMQRSDYLKTYQGNAYKQIQDNQPDQAVQEIKKGISLSPFDWYLHHLRGQVFLKQDNREAAVSELRFALWCMNNVDSHLLLAEIYQEDERFKDAKEHVQLALALDPQHKKAIQIWGKIWNRK